MSIVMHIDPHKIPMDPDQFRRESPPYSIALDGYVKGPSWLDENGPRANFNHHEGVHRPATRATCAQVLMEARTGLFERFRADGEVHINGYMLDCDQDVCTSVVLLRHPELVENGYNQYLNTLVYMEDLFDTTSGAYPFPIDMPELRQLAWVFKPYTDFRLRGGVNRCVDEEYRDVILAVEERVLRFVAGLSDSIPLEIDYQVIGGGNGWKMVEEHGAQARSAMFSDGIRAYVSHRDLGNGRHAYTIGRMSPSIPFNVLGIFEMLNAAEGCMLHCWGGSNTVGGSPHVIGSGLDPLQIQALINQFLVSKTAFKGNPITMVPVSF